MASNSVFESNAARLAALRADELEAAAKRARIEADQARVNEQRRQLVQAGSRRGPYWESVRRRGKKMAMVVGVNCRAECCMERAPTRHRGRVLWTNDGYWGEGCPHLAELYLECLDCGNITEWLSKHRGWKDRATHWSACGCRWTGRDDPRSCEAHAADGGLHSLWSCADHKDRLEAAASCLLTAQRVYCYSDGFDYKNITPKVPGGCGADGIAEFGIMPPALLWKWHQ
jgi:hypothetical protein